MTLAERIEEHLEYLPGWRVSPWNTPDLGSLPQRPAVSVRPSGSLAQGPGGYRLYVIVRAIVAQTRDRRAGAGKGVDTTLEQLIRDLDQVQGAYPRLQGADIDYRYKVVDAPRATEYVALLVPVVDGPL